MSDGYDFMKGYSPELGILMSVMNNILNFVKEFRKWKINISPAKHFLSPFQRVVCLLMAEVFIVRSKICKYQFVFPSVEESKRGLQKEFYLSNTSILELVYCLLKENVNELPLVTASLS